MLPHLEGDDLVFRPYCQMQSVHEWMEMSLLFDQISLIDQSLQTDNNKVGINTRKRAAPKSLPITQLNETGKVMIVNLIVAGREETRKLKVSIIMWFQAGLICLSAHLGQLGLFSFTKVSE